MSNFYSENGRKGGLARADKYKNKILEVVKLFYKEPHLTKVEISNKVNVSYNFVLKHTKHLKKRYRTIDD